VQRITSGFKPKALLLYKCAFKYVLISGNTLNMQETSIVMMMMMMIVMIIIILVHLTSFCILFYSLLPFGTPFLTGLCTINFMLIKVNKQA
jgi:hypothetical protein